MVHVVQRGCTSRKAVLQKFVKHFVMALLTDLKVISRQRWTGLEKVVSTIILSQSVHGLFEAALRRTIAKRAVEEADSWQAEVSRQGHVAKEWARSTFLDRFDLSTSNILAGPNLAAKKM